MNTQDYVNSPVIAANDRPADSVGDSRHSNVPGCGAVLRETFRSWSTHRASSMGAALAFYATFSLAPLLVIAIALAGFVFGADAARGEVVAQFSGLVGKDGAQTIQGLLAAAYHSNMSIWASLVAGVTSLIAATTVFAELKDSLDVVWGRKRPASSGIWALVRGRMLSFGLVLTVGFLLLISLVVSASLAALQKYWGGSFIGTGLLLEAANSLLSFVVVSMLFAAIYKWLPDPHIAWSDVMLGAIVTAALFTVGKFLIGLYLGRSDIATGFGAAASLVVILLWVYYSSQIFFLGAELTRVYAESRGSHQARSRATAGTQV